jgi:small subunit ribosomal protein S20
MPLIKSAKKRVRVSERKHHTNQLQRAGAKTAVRLATNATLSNDPEASKLAAVAVSRLDRAAQKHVIHPNKAARLKSRLAAKLKTAGIAAFTPSEKPAKDTTATKAAPKKTSAKASSTKTAAKKPAAKKSATKK